MNFIKSANKISSIDAPPIVDAICEIRFNSYTDANLIPGLLHVQLASHSMPTKISNIESAHLIPSSLRSTDPIFKNILLYELDYNSARVRFGPGSLLISAYDPYPGWKTFSSDIEKILSVFASADIIGDIERVGVRFINFIELATIKSSLNVSTRNEFQGRHSAEYSIPLREESTNLAITYSSEDSYARLSIQEPVKYIDSTSEEKEGIIIDIDAFQGEPDTSINELGATIERLHELAKSIFFASVKPDFLGKVYFSE
jgi:uncharacterized protein (TIGR04255 family)